MFIKDNYMAPQTDKTIQKLNEEVSSSIVRKQVLLNLEREILMCEYDASMNGIITENLIKEYWNRMSVELKMFIVEKSQLVNSWEDLKAGIRKEIGFTEEFIKSKTEEMERLRWAERESKLLWELFELKEELLRRSNKNKIYAGRVSEAFCDSPAIFGGKNKHINKN